MRAVVNSAVSKLHRPPPGCRLNGRSLGTANVPREEAVGELDLIKVCGVPNPAAMGSQYAVLTVFVTWLPLAIAGIVLSWKFDVRATMRGAGQLHALAHLAIAVQIAMVAIPGLLVPMFLDASWNGFVSREEGIAIAVIGSSVLLPIAAISAAGIIAWHRVLVALASREGDGRMLV